MKTPQQIRNEVEKRLCIVCNENRELSYFPDGEYDRICICCINRSEQK
jgi:hypothetical protein